MAWRDSRRSRRRLLLYVSSMSIGVAALVAIGSFRQNMSDAVEDQARLLLGADLVLRAREAFEPGAEAFVAEQLLADDGAEVSRLVSFSSMARFPGRPDQPPELRDNVRLVRVRALEGSYPYYGDYETEPPAAARVFREGGGALVDAALALQFDARVGDPVVIGRRTYPIAGTLLSVPGDSARSVLWGPRVLVPLAGLDEELLARGSRVDHQALVRLPAGVDADAFAAEHEAELRRHGLRTTTVSSREEDWSEGIDDLAAFLSLVGFVALLLGGLGVGSAMHVYVHGKIDTVATLRCLGAPAARAFAVYLVQAAALGLVGAAAGALLGLGVQRVLPSVLAEWLPVDVEVVLAPAAIARGVAIGWAAAMLFALVPLVAVRRVPPLRALRTAEQPPRDILRWPLRLLVALAVAGFAAWETGEIDVGLAFAGGVLGALLLLAGVARAVAALVRRLVPRGWSYTWRQGLANLHRPQNQTLLLMISLGLGTFLILTLHLTQHTLVEQLTLTGGGDRPNAVLFDIQPGQSAEVAGLVASLGLPVREVVPVVSMRLASVKGRSTADIAGDADRDGPRWVLRREYRSTYRSELADTETLLAGALHTGVWTGPGPAPVSLERDIAEDLGVGLGDELVFDVAGVPVETVVGSLREVDWRRVRPNFFVVFPAGVLEQAPQFHVLVTRADGPQQLGTLQREVVTAFPNVSLIDISLVLETADRILGHVSFVVRFMALFSVLAGVFVLVSSIVVSRAQRVEESALLRTLGASRAQVARIMDVEYLLLGLLATLTGLVLALAAGWALSELLFEAAFTPSVPALVLAPLAVCGLTWVVGRLQSRGVHERPPLEVLRGEV